MNTDPQKQTTVPVEQATKQERSVTVQVLTIGKRQVTQALYRQLVDENVIDYDTGNLKGEVWGWVNMHVGECDEKKPHLHTIWERDGQLRRACAYEQCWESAYYGELRREFAYLVDAYVRYIALSGKTFPNWKWRDPLTFQLGGRWVKIDVGDTIEDLWSTPERVKYLQDKLQVAKGEKPSSSPLALFVSKQKSVQEIEKDLQDLQSEERRAKLFTYIDHSLEEALHMLSHIKKESPSRENIYARAKIVATELTGIEQTWKQSYQTIQDAGQLFIAVSGVWK